MNARNEHLTAVHASNRWRVLAVLAALVSSGCASDGGGNVSTSMSVAYGGYYGPGWYGGYYYEPYPPVVVVPPGERPERPEQRPERPTTLPADVGASAQPRAKTAPSRPSNVQRPTSRPSPRPAPRPMPRMGRR